MAVDHNNPQSRTEEILIATIDGNEYDKLPQSRLEELLLELKEVIEAGGGGGGTTNYNLLSNKPQINGVTLFGEMTASDLSLVLAEVGKGLSTNDYSDEEKAKVADLITAIEGILTGTDLDSFGDVETALADKVDKVNGKGLSTNDFTDEYKAAIGSNTSAITAIKDGTDIDSFGDVEVALLDKADTSDLGTAAAKDSTNSVTAGSTDLVESGAVKDAIDSAVAAAYHHAGTKTVAQLTHDLLIAANEGNVYNITDSGTTTSDFIEGIGKQIDAGDNVGICKVGNVYMFDLLSGLEDTSGFVRKSQTSGLLKNDGTVNTTIEDTVAGHTTAINGIKDGSTIDSFDDVESALTDVDESIEAIVNKYGAKNLLPFDLNTLKALNTAGTWNGNAYTINGVTLTVDDVNKIITANGTVVNTYISFKIRSAFSLPKGKYILSGCPSGFSNNVAIHCDTINIDDLGDGNEFTLESGSTFNIMLNAGVGVAFNNTAIKPMIRDARIADPTYVPYAMTNRELTGAVDQLKSGLTDVTPVTITTNHQSIHSPVVYAEKLGKILLVSGYFYVDGQDILKDELLFTVNQSTTREVFTSLVSSTGANARLILKTNGQIYSEYTFASGCYYAFELIAFTN